MQFNKLHLPIPKGILNITKINDYFKAILYKNKNLRGNSMIRGYVTVIKNEGRKNEVIIQKDKPNLLTNAGRDFFHELCYINTSAVSPAANFIAVSANATDPAVGDTTLVGEEVGGNGLDRALATSIVHAGGTNLSTLQILFTATAAFVDLHKSALFNQLLIGGEITHSEKFTTDVSLDIGDTLTITWSLTLQQ